MEKKRSRAKFVPVEMIVDENLMPKRIRYKVGTDEGIKEESLRNVPVVIERSGESKKRK